MARDKDSILETIRSIEEAKKTHLRTIGLLRESMNEEIHKHPQLSSIEYARNVDTLLKFNDALTELSEQQIKILREAVERPLYTHEEQLTTTKQIQSIYKEFDPLKRHLEGIKHPSVENQDILGEESIPKKRGRKRIIEEDTEDEDLG